MTTESFRITGVAITPVAFADPPLLNSVGVHEPFALRAIIEIRTDAGLTGLGETYADEKHLTALQVAATSIEGVDVYHTEEIRRRVEALAAPETAIASGLIGQSAPATGCSPPSRWPAWTSRERSPDVRSPTCLAALSGQRYRFPPTSFISGPRIRVCRLPTTGALRSIPAGSSPRPSGWSRGTGSPRSSSRAASSRRRRRSRRYGRCATRSPITRCDSTRTPHGPRKRRSTSPVSWPACLSTWRTRHRASTAWHGWRGMPRCRSPPTCASWPLASCPQPSRPPGRPPTWLTGSRGKHHGRSGKRS